MSHKSVGRNAVLLLNLPPDQNGLIPEKDVQVLKEFKQIINETFSIDLAKQATAKANNYRFNDPKFASENALDSDNDTYWATDDSIFPAEIIIELPETTQFDRILIQEPIKYGQRISQFQVEIMDEMSWKTVFEGSTIGYKRLIRIAPISTAKIKLKIINANNTVAISNVGIFKSSEKENISFF